MTGRAGGAGVLLSEMFGLCAEARKTMQVTGEQVHAAMVAANITHVDHHDCGGCGAMVFYSREGDQLLFNPRCDCGGWSLAVPRDWSDAAEWINMQSNAEARNRLRAAFGLPAVA